MSEAIRTTGLTKRYRSVDALSNVDLEVERGSIYGLVGPNGAGKTTLIKLLMNVVRPTSGYAEVFGVDSTEMSGAALATVGYVSENQDLPGWMSVEYFLKYLRPFYSTWDVGTEAELVRRFDLPVKRKISQLSRGMQMKVALTSSLAYRPPLIILDEPFSGLDPLVRDELTQTLAESAHETTVFVSSHDLGEVEAVATHVGYLDRGELKLSERIGELVERFRRIELTLSSDLTNVQPPQSWLGVESSAARFRFVTDRFNSEQTRSEIQSVFGASVSNLETSRMSLRDIFLLLARNSRDRAASAAGGRG